MKIYHIPRVTKAIIFDIDSTLYTNPEYAFEQVDVQIRYFASLRGISTDEARNLVGEYRTNWANTHNGEQISLGNTLIAFGIPISESIKWRQELLEPANFITEDKKLQSVLAELSTKFYLSCVTNNPILPATKTLDALGVTSYFDFLIGLDTCGVSKPNKIPFEMAAKKTGVKIEECISVGDRFDIDLSLPLEMGMGGILVNGVDDVYTLPSILNQLIDKNI